MSSSTYTSINSSAPPLIILDNRYLLYRKIGKGATAKIYSGFDQNDPSRTLYAFKLVNLDNSNNEFHYLEKEALSKLNHSSICAMYGFGEAEAFKPKTQKVKRVLYLIIDYVPNYELFDYIYYPKMGFGDRDISKLLFAKILNVVEYIHNNNFSHRDLKTENILLDHNFNIKLCDFGFAKQNTIQSSFINLCQNELLYNREGIHTSFLGTEGYMSPELIRMKEYYGSANDIFSLGVILFIIVTGLKPFDKASINDPFYCHFYTGNYEEFWKNRHVNVSTEFKQLFQLMINVDYSMRPSISEIKCSKWLRNINCNESDLKAELSKRYYIVQRRRSFLKYRTNVAMQNKKCIFEVSKRYDESKKIKESIVLNEKVNIHNLYRRICEYFSSKRISLTLMEQKKYNLDYVYGAEFLVDNETKMCLFIKRNVINNEVYIDFIKSYGNECKCENCYNDFINELVLSR